MAYNIKAAIRAAKNMQYEPIEVKVREATNNDAWGVSTSAMADIARATHHHDEYSLLFKMVWKRLTDVEHVMHVQKALILTDYLLRNGAERFINDAKRRARDISALQKYKQYDANNRDVGGDVRAKAKNVYELLTNDAKLAEERAKAQAIRDVKLSGLGNDGYGHGDTERDTHRDRFVDGDGGADSPRTDDWEKENHGGDDDVPEYDPTRKSRQDAEVEASAEDKRREEKKKKKKEKKERAEAAEAAEAAAEEEPAPEEGEKKKKKKKKKSNADEASFDDSAAATATAASTAPSSVITSTASTPAFSASSATLDSFDAFAPSTQTSNGGAFAPQPVAATSAAAVAAPGEADKPKKSRKGKKGAAEAAAAPAAAPAAAAAPPSVAVGGDYDLTNFASIPTPRGPGNSDIDILTGTNAPAGRLEDMFAANSLMDEPLDANGDEDDGFAVEEEPALLDMIATTTAAGTMVSPRGSGGVVSAEAEPAKPKDVWDLAADFTNIDNLKGSVAKKKTNQREEVSMSMMRGMQPFGGSGSSSLSSAASSAPPAAAASPFFGAPGAGAGVNAFGGMPGMGGVAAFGAAPMHGGMGHPAASPFGMAGGFGAPPAGGMGGFPGGFGGMGGMGGGGGMGGFPGMGAPAAAPTNDLPFAAVPSAAGRTKMPANGKPLVFDAVPAAARQTGMQQPTAAHHGPTGPNWNR